MYIHLISFEFKHWAKLFLTDRELNGGCWYRLCANRLSLVLDEPKKMKDLRRNWNPYTTT